MALVEKLEHVAHFGVIVSFGNLRLELDFLHCDLHRLFAGLLQSLCLFVAELAVVHNSTYGWLG